MKIPSQNTKIVATLGPASSDRDMLINLIKAGVDIFRVNFSHGNHDQHLEVIERIQAINKEYELHIGILADLQGPKLRVGKMKDDGLPLTKGDVITFVDKECIGTIDSIYMSYKYFAQDVSVGDKVLVDDGKLELKVLSTDKKGTVTLEAQNAWTLSSNKGVNLPQTTISQPCLTEKDLKDLDFIMALETPVNWIALSFVREAADVQQLKDILEKNGKDIKVIAKVEKPEAIKNIKGIIKASNAIMIARGDLGVEIPMEKVPSLQKKIIKRCIQRARPVIVATQMMDSMITNINPTRAEVADVANAVLDGADAVMLSGETSVGKYPLKVVEVMDSIIKEAEKDYEISSKRPKPDYKSGTFVSDVICINAAKTAEEVRAKGIASITVSGYTAFKISSYRPNSPIYIFSSKQSLLATLNLVWGVRGFYYDKFTSTDETIEDIIEILKSKKLIKKGELLVNTGSMPLQKRFRTNMLKVTLVE